MFCVPICYPCKYILYTYIYDVCIHKLNHHQNNESNNLIKQRRTTKSNETSGRREKKRRECSTKLLYSTKLPYSVPTIDYNNNNNNINCTLYLCVAKSCFTHFTVSAEHESEKFQHTVTTENRCLKKNSKYVKFKRTAKKIKLENIRICHRIR